MASFFSGAAIALPNCNYRQRSNRDLVCGHQICFPSFDVDRSCRSRCSLHGHFRSSSALCKCSLPSSDSRSNEEEEEEDPESQVSDLRIPDRWLEHSVASQQKSLGSILLYPEQFLAYMCRVTLHKWLDDEYCPEETNVLISKVAAASLYKSLLQKQTDLGEVLLRMGRELEYISYQDSFHGAYSSANAAVDLIAQRIEQEQA